MPECQKLKVFGFCGGERSKCNHLMTLAFKELTKVRYDVNAVPVCSHMLG